jgi:hypothetical protein
LTECVTVLALANATHPPLRLPLGSDTLARIEDKHRSVTARAT